MSQKRKRGEKQSLCKQPVSVVHLKFYVIQVKTLAIIWTCQSLKNETKNLSKIRHVCAECRKPGCSLIHIQMDQYPWAERLNMTGGGEEKAKEDREKRRRGRVGKTEEKEEEKRMEKSWMEWGEEGRRTPKLLLLIILLVVASSQTFRFSSNKETKRFSEGLEGSVLCFGWVGPPVHQNQENYIRICCWMT